MRRSQKPAKSKAKPPVTRKSPKDEGARVRDLEKRLAEAQEQQAATAEILKVISRSTFDLQPVLETLIENAMKLCDAQQGTIWRFDGKVFRVEATYRRSSSQFRALELRPGRESTVGRVALEQRAVQILDVLADPEYQMTGVQNRAGYRTIMGIPMLRESTLVGAFTLARTEVRAFTDKQIELVTTFADQAVIAIENVRLFTELQEKNRALTQAHAQVTEALDQQTATSEILRVISRSPTDIQPVLDAVAESATRLCESLDAAIMRRDGDRLRLVAHHGPVPFGPVGEFSFPMVREWVAGRTVLDGRTVHVADLQSETDEFPVGSEFARQRGFRTALCVPLMREGVAIGTIVLRRTEAQLFTDKQIALLQTFADQAVIAIENVRLFNETKEALERQTATSEILRVISSSPTDVQPVFDAVAKSAARLCDARDVGIVRLDGGLRMVAGTGVFSEMLAPDYNAQHIPATRGSVTGRAITDRMTIHVHDLAEESEAEYPHGRALQRRYGHRTMLATPLLREGLAMGAISICRFEVRPFSESQIALLRTFADQAVIAIENVRLFKELEVANRELAVASQHKSEFLANMSHELRTPLNAIIGFSEVLSEKMFGELNEKQEEYSKDIHASGQHLLSLINDILDLSKIEAGRMELELTDFHLPTALDSALTLVRERAGRRGIALHLAVDERLGQMRADERKVRQVVLNLLSNAIKFTPEGGRIEVLAAPKDGSVEVSVTDTGVGIAPEDQEAVFEEFRQVGTADKKVEGTGLGLTLCRKFIELHGGKIWVKSQLGAGSTFTFTIPVRQGE